VIIHRFVQVHHQRPALLEELAAELRMSASRTSHVVRETCGMSFRELLIEARLNTAMGLLRATNLSVLEVSIRSGFPEIAHFHRMFRNRVGTTPRQYRIKNQT
jgi:AraC-like DNA-binding protein